LRAANILISGYLVNLPPLLKYGLMIWKKVKKLIIPLAIIKFVFFIFFISRSELVSISRELTHTTNYQEEIDKDSLVINRQKLIQIVRNEDEPGISIKLRGRKNGKYLTEKDGDLVLPIID